MDKAQRENRNRNTADAIYRNLIERLKDGQEPHIDNYFCNPEVKAILAQMFHLTPLTAASMGIEVPKPKLHEKPVNIEAYLRKSAKSRESSRHDQLHAA